MCSLLRTSTEHILIVRGLRARGASVPFHHPKCGEASGTVPLTTNKKATASVAFSLLPSHFLAGVVRGGPYCADL
jgi:hypothetical protein